MIMMMITIMIIVEQHQNYKVRPCQDDAARRQVAMEQILTG
jgi:hypothetical protein